MGATASIAPVIFGGQKAVQSIIPQMPAPVILTFGPTPDDQPGSADPQRAADAQRKRAAAAGGRADTIKTGPQGLGEVGDENRSQKTLLGY